MFCNFTTGTETEDGWGKGCPFLLPAGVEPRRAVGHEQEGGVRGEGELGLGRSSTKLI